LPDAPTAQTTLGHLEIVNPLGQGTWQLRDRSSGKTYFMKLTTASEVETTLRAASIRLPADSNFVLPRVLAADPTLPAHLNAEVNAFLTSETGQRERPGRTRILITEAVPNRTTLGELVGNPDAIQTALRGQPISREEWQQMMRTVEALNKAGVENRDFASNMFVERGTDGRLRFHAIDFEPDTFAPMFAGQLSGLP